MTNTNVGEKLVCIVEELAMCQKQLGECKSFGERSLATNVGRLEDVTVKLGKIAEKLFEECKKGSPKKENVKKLAGEDVKVIIRAAPLCMDGINCGFGLRGHCAFFHPELEKTRELVNTLNFSFLVFYFLLQLTHIYF